MQKGASATMAQFNRIFFFFMIYFIEFSDSALVSINQAYFVYTKRHEMISTTNSKRPAV